MTQTITAMFDSRSDAQAAIAKLTAAGIPQASIRLLPDAEGGYSRTERSSYDHQRDEGGFWASLKDAFLPEEDRYAYSEGMSRGGVMLAVTAETSNAAAVMDVLEDAGAVNIDEREAAWRKEGWSGYAAGATTASATTAGAATGTAAAGTGAAYAAQSTEATGATGRDEAIPIVEERLNVGKRVTEHGRVRLRSYVVETPVTEQVSLRDETVRVERRPVDRALTGADEALFRERTIEAVERDEEAVVSKEARVTGEVGLRKEVAERTETITDKVRKTEVEVEDERGQANRTGTTNDPARR